MHQRTPGGGKGEQFIAKTTLHELVEAIAMLRIRQYPETAGVGKTVATSDPLLPIFRAETSTLL